MYAQNIFLFKIIVKRERIRGICFQTFIFPESRLGASPGSGMNTRRQDSTINHDILKDDDD